jgi:FixJ family two-component response regulator
VLEEEAMNGRVLVVDDDAALLEVYADTLRDAGFEVRTASSAGAAAAVLASARFDVVLSDILLPDESGLAVMKAVQAQGRDVPVVFVTGHPTLETAIAAVESGATRYLLKPVSREDLLRTVGEVVARSRERSREQERQARLGAVRDRLGEALDRAVAPAPTACEPIVDCGDGALFAYAVVLAGRGAGPSAAALMRAAERLGRFRDVGRAVRRSAAGIMQLAGRGLPFFVPVPVSDIESGALLDPDEPLRAQAHDVVLDITLESGDRPVPPEPLLALRSAGYRLAVADRWLDGSPSGPPLDFVRLPAGVPGPGVNDPLERALLASTLAAANERGARLIASGTFSRVDRGALADLGCPFVQQALGSPGEEAHDVEPRAPRGVARVSGLIRRLRSSTPARP